MSAHQARTSLVDALVCLPVRRPVGTLIVTAIVVLLAVASITRLEPVRSLQAMMDDHDPSAVALGRILSNFGSVDKLLMVASLPSSAPANRAPLAEFAGRFNESIGSDHGLRESVSEVRFTRGGLHEDRAFFEQHVIPAGLYYLTDGQFADLVERLEPESMLKQIRRNEELIAAPGPAADALSRVLQKDPLRLRDFLGEALADRAGTSLSMRDELMLSRDHRSLLIIIGARRPATDLDFTKRFLHDIQSVADNANNNLLTIEYSGAYAIAAASERAIRSDMIRSVIIAVMLMQLMFLVMHRRPFAFIVAFVPTAVAIVVAFGLHAIIQLQLTPATAVVGAVIAGLGIDYSIHVVSHYGHARQVGASPAQAAHDAAGQLFLPTIAAAGTTFIGVLAISQSPVGALRDFSIVALLGLVGAMIAAFTILPALLVILDRVPLTGGASSYQFAARFTLAPLTMFIDRYARAILAIAIITWIAIIAGVMSRQKFVPVERDLTAMHPKPNPALDLQERIARDFDVPANSLLVHLEAGSADDLVIASHDVANAIHRPEFKSRGLHRVLGLSTFLVDPRTITRRQAAISQVDVERVLNDFHNAIDQSLFSRNAFVEFEVFLRRFLTASAPPDLDTLRQFEQVANTVLPRDAARSETMEAICVLRLDQPLAERAQRDQTIGAVREALADIPRATLTGLTVISHDVERSIASDLARLSLIAAAAVIMFLAIFVRNPLHLLLALTPTAGGLTFVLAGFHFFNDGLNMINLVGIPLLMGIGDNFGIFVIDALRRHRAVRLPSHEFAPHLAASARAIILTSITAILGFGSLMFTSTPAIQSLGRLTALGVSASLACTLFVVMPITFLIARRSEACGTS